MKKFLLVLLMILWTHAAWATNYCNDANNKGCWLYNTGSGTTSYDTGANTTNNGSFSGGGVSWSSTVPNAQSTYSAQFSGSSSYISVPNNASLNYSGDFTICDWARSNGATAYTDIEEKYDAGSTNGYILQWGGTSDKWYGGVIIGGTNHEAKSNSNGSDTTWTHVCVVRSSGTITMYINGAAQTTTASSSSDSTTTTSLYFGSNYNGGGGNFKGNITASAHFNRALSPTEINDIYTNGLTSGAGVSSTNTLSERPCSERISFVS